MQLTKKKIINYWDQFYKKKKVVQKPTTFSRFCLNYLKNYKGILYDTGCGNGRDTIFFNKNKILTFGLDISSNVIKNNKKKYYKISNKFKKKNFCIYFKKIFKENFSIYSRFTIHTINRSEEKLFFSSLLKQKKLNYVFIETRTIDDELFGVGKKIGRNEYFSDHYRRFIIPREIKKYFLKNYEILYFKKSNRFARYKKFKPNVLRIIARKII